MINFFYLLEKIFKESSSNNKLNILTEYLSDFKNKDDLKKYYDLLLDNSNFKKKMKLSLISLKKIFSESLQIKNIFMIQEYQNYIKNDDLLKVSNLLDLSQLYAVLSNLSISGPESQSKKKDILQDLINHISKRETFWVIRLILGLKIGINKKSIEKVFSNLEHKVSELKINPMLCCSGNLGKFSTYKDLLIDLKRKGWTSFFIQKKLDGFRAIIVIKNGKIQKIFSRNQVDLTENLISFFPEEITNTETNLILDGELYSENSFQELSQIIMRQYNREKILLKNFKFTIFDILEYNNICLKKETIQKRLNILYKIQFKNEIFSKIQTTFLEQIDIAKIEDLLENAYSDYEGLVLKKYNSTYDEGKRSVNWIKLKRNFETLDVAITKAYKGEGAKSKFFAAFEMSVIDKVSRELKIIGHVGSGFLEKDLEFFTKKIMEDNKIIKIEQVLCLKTPLIFEIKFQGFQCSKSIQTNKHKLSCRFPVFLRERLDKNLSEVNYL